MTEFHLRGAEIDCVKTLLDLYEKGIFRVIDGEIDLKIPEEKRHTILSTMESMQIIGEIMHGRPRTFYAFTILPSVIQVARSLEKSEEESTTPRDVVAQVIEKSKSNPWVAWLIIGAIVITGVGSVLNVAVTVIGFFRSPESKAQQKIELIIKNTPGITVEQSPQK